MKLILHIGTHKTATTSMQHFCALNRKFLLKEAGVFYPATSGNAYHFNNWAANLALGRDEVLQKNLQHALEIAQKKKANSVLISAESLYAMSTMFRNLGVSDPAQRVTDDTYWANERALIEKLHKMTQGFESVQIIAYLRPQDDFATSLYNQMVKSTANYTNSYEGFVTSAPEMFNYQKHFDLWADIFAKDSLSLHLFDDAKPDPAAHFASLFLPEDILKRTPHRGFEANERLCRDVFEFKKRMNERQPRKTLSYMIVQALWELNRDFEAQSPKSQIYASESFRSDFFEPYTPGNAALKVSGGSENILPVLRKDGDDDYPGLSEKRFEEIEAALNKILDRPANRLELWMKDLAQRLEAGGYMRGVLQYLRTLKAHWRLHRQGW